ncbi:MAG: hypothetical protein Q8N81_07770, partial [bacterium]|nr:hypothetical protein [bacterium]
IAAGVVRVVLGKVYRNEQVMEMLKSANVATDVYQENPAWGKELLNIFSEDIPTRVNEGAVKLEQKP